MPDIVWKLALFLGVIALYGGWFVFIVWMAQRESDREYREWFRAQWEGQRGAQVRE